MDRYLVLGFIISLTLSYIFLPKIVEMLIDSSVTCENYEKKTIPTSVGIGFIFTQVITIGILETIAPTGDNFNLIYLLGFVFMGVLGLLDDLIGDSRTKGLKGHLMAVYKGTLTTGALKAFLGFFISLMVSIYLSNSIVDIIINSLIVGLFTNFINIFDLRPGRSTKVFMVISIIFIMTGVYRENNYILLSFFGILIPYITLDFKAKAMMGDTGSNILGFTLGIYATVSFDLHFRYIVLNLLILIHVLAEKVSFSKIIENNRVLRYLDSLGR